MKTCTLFRNLPLMLLAIILAVACAACQQAPTEFAVETADDSLVFDAVTVSYREGARNIEGLGSLQVHDKATVISRIDGVVEKIFFKKGDRVNKGAVLIELSNFQLELEKIKVEQEVLTAEEELETARIQYMEEEKALYKKFFQLEKLALQIMNYEKEIEFLQNHVKRKKLLYEKGGITEEEFRNLNFSLESKQRELGILKKEYELQSFGFGDRDLIENGIPVPGNEEERRRLLVFINTKLSRKRIEFAALRLKKEHIELDRINWLIENTRIRAPIGGVVADFSTFVGEKVNADQAVTTILNPDTLIARVAFSETDLPKLKEQTEVDVYIDSLQVELKGVIYSIDPYIDVKTRSFSVDCLIHNEMNLVPGMFVKVKIPVQKVERKLLIPREAFIKEKENEGYVYIVTENDRLFKKKVTCREFDSQFLTIIDGLKEGDIIIKNPLMNLMDGMKVSLRRI